MKMKKFFAGTLAFAMMFGTVTSFGKGDLSVSNIGTTAAAVYSYVDNNLRFNIYSDHAEIAQNDSSQRVIKGELVIPSVIQDLPVTRIATWAFYDCTGLTSITIPESVTSIGNSAFSSCTGLTSLTLPNGLTDLGNTAFNRCESLTSIIIPGNIKCIERDTFNNCKELKSVIISEGVESIDSSAFYECTKLDSITIPGSIKSIGDFAFEFCEGLTSISLPDGVESIGKYSFSKCKELKSIDLPNSLKSIGESAFYKCSGLTFVEIPDSVTSIGGGVFASCSSLTSVTFPDGITNIPPDTFLSCGFTSFTIPESIINIGYGAFCGCESLESVTIPASVTDIGDRAFNKLSKTASITILNPECKLKRSIDNSSYGISKYKYTVYGYRGSTAQTEAEKYGYTFIALDDLPVTTTSTTSTTTTTTTTTTELATTTIATQSSTTTTTTTTQPITTASTSTTASTTASQTATASTTETQATTTTPEQTETIGLGDPNNDDKVDSKDATLVLVEYANLSVGNEASFTEAQQKAADVNKDGRTDAKDASIILAYYSYISTGGTMEIEAYLGNNESETTTAATTTQSVTTATETTTIPIQTKTYKYELADITQSAEVFNYFAEQMNYDIFRESNVLSQRASGEEYWNNGEKECKVALFLLNEQEKFKDGVLREVFKGYSDLDIADGVMYFYKASFYQELCNGYVDFDDYALDKDISNYMNKIEEAWKYALDNKEYEDMETILNDYFDNKYEKPSYNSAAYYYTTGVGTSFIESKYYDMCQSQTKEGFYGMQQLTEEKVRELSK